MVKEKRGRRGGQGEDAWSIKFDNVHIQLRIIIKLLVNSNITLYILSVHGLSPSKASSLIKPKSKAHGFYEVLNPLLTFLWGIGFTKNLSIDCHHKGHIVRHHYNNMQFDGE